MLKLFVVVSVVLLVKLVVGENFEEFCKTKPKSTNALPCCSMPLSAFEDSWSRCLQDAGIALPDNGNVLDVNPELLVGKCIGDCVFEAAGLLSGKELQLDMIKARMCEATRNNNAWANIVEAAVQNATMSIENLSEEGFKCETKGDMFLQMFTVLLLLNCPESEWQQGEICDDVKSRLENCGTTVDIPPK